MTKEQKQLEIETFGKIGFDVGTCIINNTIDATEKVFLINNDADLELFIETY
jgi:hypothetical protein